MDRIILLILLLSSSKCFAQIPDSTIVEGDKIPVELLNEIIVTPLNLNQHEQIQYYRLRRKVYKVYPYAVKAKQQLEEIEVDLQFAKSKRHKRKIAKLHDQWIQENFTNEIKKLTRSEGRILIKLIHLKTGSSAYDLVKNYRNRFSAYLWQRLAKLYDGNLKSTFDSTNNKEDLWIEHIIRKMDAKDHSLIK